MFKGIYILTFGITKHPTDFILIVIQEGIYLMGITGVDIGSAKMLNKPLNKLLTWLDGYDRNMDVYTRAVSPDDNWKMLIVILLPIVAIALTIILILTK
jgi:hypothetical protein